MKSNYLKPIIEYLQREKTLDETKVKELIKRLEGVSRAQKQGHEIETLIRELIKILRAK